MTKPEGRRYDIQERALKFASNIAIMAGKMPKILALIEYCKQLVRSSSSIGANIEEADGTLTKKDFINKLAIARREARESKYWLMLIKRAELNLSYISYEEIDILINESHEMMLILSSIINKVQNKI